MHIDERREPQDGRLDMEYGPRKLSARMSVLPDLNGEKIVMRILDPMGAKVELEKLGMPPDVLKKWANAVQSSYGLVLVTGPTGSGKTSTLYASLNKLDRQKRNIVTVEDPVEYEFSDHITQVQVTEKMTFPRVMRSFLRQDPDVMLVGEMRDPESLGIGIQASLTGHLVLSSLHTNNAIETVGRMMDMGGEPYLIASTLQAVMAQRLVRTICTHCKAQYQPTADELIEIGLDPKRACRASVLQGRGLRELPADRIQGPPGAVRDARQHAGAARNDRQAARRSGEVTEYVAQTSKNAHDAGRRLRENLRGPDHPQRGLHRRLLHHDRRHVNYCSVIPRNRTNQEVVGVKPHSPGLSGLYC